MEGEAGILQQRVQPPAVQRRRIEPGERVGGQQDEQVEADGDPRLHRQRPRPQARR